MASTDPKAGLGLLDVRLVAGDADLAARLRTATLASWRQAASRLLPAAARPAPRPRPPARRAGLPARARPQGGLRRPARGAGPARGGRRPARRRPDARSSRQTYAFLLDVRDELRRRTGRPSDVLVRQEQRPVADALGLADEDALLREVSLAGRRAGVRAPTRPGAAWRRRLVRRPARPVPPGAPRAAGRGRRAPGRRGRARPRRATRPPIPGCCCAPRPPPRRADLLLSPYTLKVLAVHSPPVPEPWPAEVRWSFLRLLASGRAAVAVLEQLDQEGLLSRLIPEWDRVRSLPQRHPWHRFTVDRHLVEAAAAAAELTRDVDRPDLLLVAALLHDIGKGWPGDHSVVGEPIAGRDRHPDGLLAGRTSRRSAPWCATTCCCPPTATRRDIDDPATVDRVADDDRRTTPPSSSCCTPSRRPTGRRPSTSAWSPWKAHLVAALVARVQAAARRRARRPSREPVLHPTEPQARAGAGREATGRGHRRHRGRRRRPAGHHRRARPARAAQHLRGRAGAQPARRAGGEDVGRGRPRRRGVRRAPAVRPRAGAGDPRRRRPRRAGGHAAAGRPAAAARGRLPPGRRAVGARRASPGTTARSAATRPASSRSAPRDRAGLLYRLTAAIAGEGLDVTSARIETLGGDAVDCFYVATPRGRRWTPSSAAGSSAALSRPRRGAHEAEHDPAVSGGADTPS